jgi:glycosyltransferase involved in cell wall biosynthesis
MGSAVLVSCIMPTRDRREFVSVAVQAWLRQDYPERELVVVDSGADSVADDLPRSPRVRYLRAHAGMSLGEARNLACSAASGPVIAHWDDDDWIRPDRLRRQLLALEQPGANACGLATLTYVEPRSGRAWRYSRQRNDQPWLAGGTLMYRREVWQHNKFRHVTVGEDGSFVAGLDPRRVVAMTDDGWYVAILHGRNTGSRYVADGRWAPVPLREVPGHVLRSLPQQAASQIRLTPSDPVDIA